jgi:4-hydroxyphenylpyruvate dioxygenase
VVLDQLGFTPRGRHRTKDVSLWTAGPARVVLDEQHARERAPYLSAVGLAVPDERATSARARELSATIAHRRTYAGEQVLDAAVSPSGTEVYWADAVPGEPAWVSEFEHGRRDEGPALVVDHVNLAQPWQAFDESVLFHTGVLGLVAEAGTEVASPQGLVRSQVMRTPDGGVRIPLNLAPPGQAHGLLQHVAFRTDDVLGLAAGARERGLRFLSVPANYYDDLQARFGLEAAFVERLQALDVLYDRSPAGEFVHFYTRTVGDLFLEFVERRGGYDGYGEVNAPVRLAAQRRLEQRLS